MVIVGNTEYEEKWGREKMYHSTTSLGSNSWMLSGRELKRKYSWVFLKCTNCRKITWNQLYGERRARESQCENYTKTLSHSFDKNFVKATCLTESWFHEIFFGWKWISRFSTHDFHGFAQFFWNISSLCSYIRFYVKSFGWNSHFTR